MISTNDFFEYIKEIVDSKYPELTSTISMRKYLTKGEKTIQQDFFDASISFGSVVAIQIFHSTNKLRLVFKKNYEDLIINFQKYYLKSKENNVCIDIFDIRELDMLKNVIFEILDNSVKKDIGCCSHYLECSDSLCCVNKYPEIYLHCSYRQKLNNGIIYYGVNRNI